MRTVNELMALGTYQGMTDEEIDSIIEHVIFNARQDGIRMERSSAQALRQKELHEAQLAQMQAATEALQRQVAAPLVLQEVTFDE